MKGWSVIFKKEGITLGHYERCSCQRHVNERTSFCDGSWRRTRANVSECQERKFVKSEGYRLGCCFS
jgi:hypothetical protein